MSGATILGCGGTRLAPEERAFFAEADPWGFILFSRNVAAPEQLRRLTDALRDAVGREAPVFIDQEGGRVQRLRPPHWQDWPAPLKHVRRAGPAAAAVLRLRYRLIAAELRAVGIDGNCVPCADVAGPATHPFLRDRCLGETPEAVGRLARAAAEGSLAGGVLPVVKHLPGHGRAAADSHHELPRLDAPLEALRASEFAAFRPLADLPLGMTAHVVYEAIDAERCATLSPAGIRVIREEIGFDGLLMTDDLSMGALEGPLASRTEAALAAGCDVALHCNGKMAEMEAVVLAAGRLTAAAAARAERALAARRAPDGAEPAALLAALGTFAEPAHG